MATVRLSNYIKDTIIKDTIIKRLLKHGFDEREKALRVEENSLGDAVYKDVYSLEIRRLMDDMPRGFLLEKDVLRVSFEGNGFCYITFGEYRRISKSHECNAAKVYDSKHPLSKRYYDFEKRKSALKDEKQTARSNARAVLDSVSTLKKLIEVWPEVGPYVEDFEPSATGKAMLPALSLKNLNEALGLKGEAS